MAVKQCMSSCCAYLYCSHMGISLNAQWSCAVDSSFEYHGYDRQPLCL